MKQFLKSIIFFIPFSVLIYIFLVFLWGSFLPEFAKPNINYRIGSDGHTYSRLKEAEVVRDVDILFLGSSHAYRGFDTRIYKKYGIKTFNLGSSGQTPTHTFVLVNRYLEQLNPKLIVYEVYPKTFSSDGVESALNLIANQSNDLLTASMALDLNHTKVYNTLIYGLTRDFFKLNSSFEESKYRLDDTYIEGGFVERKISHYQHASHPSQEWTFNETQFAVFDQIVSEIKKKNIDLILVNAPITSSLYNSYTNNTTFDSLMSDYGNYYNFNSIINLDDSLHFYDSHHLNQTGVQIFNKELIKTINLEHLILDK